MALDNVEEKKDIKRRDYNATVVSVDLNAKSKNSDKNGNHWDVVKLIYRTTDDQLKEKEISHGSLNGVNCKTAQGKAAAKRHKDVVTKLKSGDDITVTLDVNNYGRLLQTQKGHVAKSPISGGGNKGGSFDSIGAQVGQALNAATLLVANKIISPGKGGDVVTVIKETAARILHVGEEIRKDFQNGKSEAKNVPEPDIQTTDDKEVF
jgi:hypothetical protein